MTKHTVPQQKTKKKKYANVENNTRKLIGKKTGKKVKKTGRDKYKVREDHPLAGETVSELGATVPIAAETTTGDEVWLNAPSLHNGYEYTDDEIREIHQEEEPFKLKKEEISLHPSEAEGIQASMRRSEELDENSLHIPPMMDEEELM